jgi:hypothetical protein
MLQRQIVKAGGYQIDIEDLTFTKYTATGFYYIAQIFISVIVTINRTVPIQMSCITTIEARSNI